MEYIHPVKMRSDNYSTISLVSPQKFGSTRAKQIDVKMHLLGKILKSLVYDVRYFSSGGDDVNVLAKQFW